MKPSLLFSNRYLRLGLVAIALLFLGITLLAPAAGQRTSGSTFNPAPEGYLGWYQYMEAQGMPVQRWQRPVEELSSEAAEGPQTLVRVYPGLADWHRWPSAWADEWLAAGNSLVVLGLATPITEAPFSTRQDSPYGKVVIDTRRRDSVDRDRDRQALGDQYGAVVWREQDPDLFGEVPDVFGKFYTVATPHLAANAYLEAPGNYAFLASLASEAGGAIWVDEYIHGYRTMEELIEDATGNWLTYLEQTPVKIAVAQIGVLLLLFLISQNVRLGNLAPLKSPSINNSQAYIAALAAVLHKAKSSSFLVDMIVRAERAALHKSLGFHETGVADEDLRAAWRQQTGQSDSQLTPLLQTSQQLQQQSDTKVAQWLTQLASIHRFSRR